MKLKFKHQPYQAAAVDAVADCFARQQPETGERYQVDPGRAPSPQRSLLDDSGFRNPDIRLDESALLANIQGVKRRANLPLSEELVASKAAKLNLDIEMETGTGKTYVYIKTLFELHRRFG